MDQQSHRACERTKSEVDLVHKQYSFIIKGWFHIIITDLLNVMSFHGANQIYFNKKTKDWTSRTIVHALRLICVSVLTWMKKNSENFRTDNYTMPK